MDTLKFATPSSMISSRNRGPDQGHHPELVSIAVRPCGAPHPKAWGMWQNIRAKCGVPDPATEVWGFETKL